MIVWYKRSATSNRFAHLLIEDIDRFEEHLVTRRETVRAALASLNDLVDNEDGFESLDVPEPSAIPVFDPDDYEAVGVDLPDGLDQPTSEAPTAEGFLFGENPTSSFAEPSADDAFDGSATQLFEVVLTDAVDDEPEFSDHDEPEFSDHDEPDAFAAFSDDDAGAADDGADVAVDDSPAITSFETDTDVAAARPAWADAVPPEAPTPSASPEPSRQPTPKGQPSSVSDPFLDELRRATGPMNPKATSKRPRPRPSAASSMPMTAAVAPAGFGRRK
ncbi:MAG: hypothetical protein R2706_07220 [Acidimicrobiales bacterium]